MRKPFGVLQSRDNDGAARENENHLLARQANAELQRWYISRERH